jgi:hypothetical protein
MALRIPLSPDQTAQVEFHEIERRLRRLEKTLGTNASQGSRITVFGSSGGGSVNLTPILARITALEDAVANISPTTYQDFGGVGATSSRGLVPEPGVPEPPTGVAQHLLTESGEWGFPLRGLIGVATPGDETVGSDTVNLEANLIATGKVVATSLEASEIRAHGIVYGEPEQARLRGLVQVATEPGQSDIVDDKIAVLADVHMQDLSANRIECMDIAVFGTASITATIDGGVP